MLGIEKIDHICVAVWDLEQAKAVWGPFLGKEVPDLDSFMNGVLVEVIDWGGPGILNIPGRPTLKLNRPQGASV